MSGIYWNAVLHIVDWGNVGDILGCSIAYSGLG
jgi:hypothetical protein